MSTRETERAQRGGGPTAGQGPARSDAVNASEDAGSTPAPSPAAALPARVRKGEGKQPGREQNRVRQLRSERMMSKAELARRAGLSTLTVDRVEKGMPCRMDTKRKILEALGLTPTARVTVFGDDD